MKSVGAKNRPFPRPSGVVTAIIDSATGLLAAPGAPIESTVTEVFLTGTEPTEIAPLPGEVDATTFVIDEYGDEVPHPSQAEDDRATSPVATPE
jgi:hypothetical protein